MAGSALSGLLGAAPGAVAAFRWTAAGGWEQVPVQVDERALVPWLQVYGGFIPPEELGPQYKVLSWCDPTTFTGPDPDPALDADDEVALASIDAGERAPFDAPLPAGALSAGATELRLVDPLEGAVGWLYLVRHDGLLDPAAGEDRVHYAFHLASGLSYLDGYAVLGSPNPELSSVTAPGVWSTGFFDRWIRDGLWVHDGVAASVDLIDRQRTGSDPPECLRNEDTYCGYTHDPSEGAFLANIDGPVRAIRSLVGANSGLLTQRDHVFWQRREDMVMHVRVHPISHPDQDALNLALSALGSRFYAPWVPEQGLVLDGDPAGDPAAPLKPPTWEMVTGELGTLISSHKIFVDDPGAKIVSVLADDLAPDSTPCTGDEHSISVFGWRLDNQLGNTDPRLEELYGVLYTARIERVLFFEPPDQPPELAKLRHAQHKSPIKVSAAPFGAAAAGSAPPPPPAPVAVGATPSGLVVAPLSLPGAGAVTWSVASGPLPPGLALDPAGVLRGRTRAPGEHRLVLRADHAAGSTLVEVELSVPDEAALVVPGWVARLPLVGPWIERTFGR